MMAIAAVPSYLPADYADSSPALRFGMYLKLWGQDRRTGKALWTTHDLREEARSQNSEIRKDETKSDALQAATPLTDRDQETLKQLLQRQHAMFGSHSEMTRLQLRASSRSPFATGLGNEHPLENGFAFLNPYGLPYLPGSGIKGVLRRAAEELASGMWGESHGWGDELCHTLGKSQIDLSPVEVLFGKEPSSGDGDAVRGALSFWDVIPQLVGTKLMVDIMTPHQSHYYQAKADRKAGGSASPHDSGQPNPIHFLAVPPGSEFHFFVTCDIGRLPESLRRDDTWKKLLGAAFEHAFDWLGFGAKTAVGYGAMYSAEAAAKDREAQDRAAAELRQQNLKEAGISMNTMSWTNARVSWDKGKQTLTILGLDNQKVICNGDEAKRHFNALSESAQKRLKDGKKPLFVDVTVEQMGNSFTLCEIQERSNS